MTANVDMTDGRVIPIRNEFAAWQQRIGYTLAIPDCWSTLTHTSRANEEVSGGGLATSRRVPVATRGAGFRDCRHMFRRFQPRRRMEGEDEAHSSYRPRAGTVA